MTIEQKIPAGRITRRPDLGLEARVMHKALASIHHACSPLAASAAGAWLVETGSMCLSIAARLPTSAIVLNHGFVEAEADALAKAASVYRETGVERFFLSVDRAPEPAAIARAGIRPARGWRKFRRAAAQPVSMRVHDVPVRKAAPGGAGNFARIVSDAFDLGDAARPLLACLPEASGWHVFQAEHDEEVTGTGALYVSGGYGWTDFGATRPESRGRGIQKALLAHRIEYARALGCHTVLTCTGEAVPGEAQISYRNILALGFEEAELMINFKPKL